MKLNCLLCQKEFNTYPSKIRDGRGKYCSRSCMGKINKPKGSQPWNKNKKGIHLSPASEFKKGITPKNSYIFGLGETKFTGTPNEYKALHYRISKLLGKPTVCEDCKKSGLEGKKIHWANISGKYQEIKADWKRLCVRCHYIFDKQDSRKIKGGDFLAN